MPSGGWTRWQSLPPRSLSPTRRRPARPRRRNRAARPRSKRLPCRRKRQSLFAASAVGREEPGAQPRRAGNGRACGRRLTRQHRPPHLPLRHRIRHDHHRARGPRRAPPPPRRRSRLPSRRQARRLRRLGYEQTGDHPRHNTPACAVGSQEEILAPGRRAAYVSPKEANPFSLLLGN